MTLNQRLAAAAFVLGAVTIFAQPMRGSVVSIDTRDLTRDIQHDADRVAPRDLADWIVQGRGDFRLIDVREPEAFAQYHIPGAENVPIGALAGSSLLRTEKLVVYADEAIRAAQAWLLLKGMGYRAVYTVQDGLEGWKTDVLFPLLSDASTPYLAQRNARLAYLAKHFGGQPRQNGDGVTEPVLTAAMPDLPTMVPAPAGSATAGDVKKKKKKEGC